MSVDNTTAEPNSGIHQNGGTGDHINGVTNGYPEKHKSSHKSSSHDKHRSKDKDKERSKDHKSSSSKHSSSSSRDKDKHSSSSKDKERSHSHKSSSKDKDREGRSDKDKSSSNKERSSDKERSDKDRSDKDKHRSKEHKSSSRDKDGERKESSSSSSHRDKDKSKHKHSSSSRDHDDKSRSKDKERHRDKDKERSKDKHRDKHRDRESSSSKSKSSDSGDTSTSQEVVPSDSEFIKPSLNCIKEEIESQEIEMPPMKIEVDSSSAYESKAHLNDSQSSCDYSMTQFKDEVKEELPPEDEELEEETYEDEEENNENDQDEDYEENVEIKPEVKEEEPEEDSEEDIPLSARVNNTKRKIVSEEDSEEDVPISQRKKKKTEKKTKKAKKRSHDDDDDDYDDVKPAKTKVKKEKTKVKKEKTQTKVKTENATQQSPTKGRKKKVEEEQEVWKWWEEEKKNDGTKWTFLEHKGPLFAPPYERLPENVKFLYDGKVMELSQDAEEVACFYAKMLNHDYTSKPVFNENFFKDWRKTMTQEEKNIIKDLTKCDFRKMNAYFTDLSERNKQRTKEEKLKLKEQNEALVKEYGFCKIDGHTEKIGNFKIEPPGLFRGRGEHPKMGMVKKRVMPEDVLLNCSKDSVIPVPPPGHKWKEIRHDNTVTWLASWTENVQGQVKYVMLNPSSKLKGEKDWQKYETARKLAKCIEKIRETYIAEWKAKEMKVRQRAVALYFIDRLALRAGNEKDEDQADTVGCCSLRVEHIELHKEKDGKEYVVVFDFLGKDSIRYYNEIPVEKRVFKNLELFKENKKAGDDLFDRLNTTVLNEHLRELMDGLTAKVFRTYNASITLQNQLQELTDPDASIPEKMLAYNRANRAVAILCNHQRAVPKSHDKSMSNLREKMNQKREQIDEMEKQVKDAAKAAKRGSVKEKVIHEKKKKALDRLKDQLKKMEVQETDRDENKTIALGTSKLNYLDPRISVAWCKKFGVPIEKVYNKTQRDKFRWAIDMATEDYIF